MSDIKTEAIVLKRVNYNEGDRIVTFLTPDGRVSGIAKGARREKSKLAGGIEMFCLSKIVVHQRDTKKTESESEQFGVLTSAKAIEFYQNIISDLETLELASNFLKQISRITHHISSAELFSLTRQTLYYLNQFYLDQNRRQLISIYFKSAGKKSMYFMIAIIKNLSRMPHTTGMILKKSLSSARTNPAVLTKMSLKFCDSFLALILVSSSKSRTLLLFFRCYPILLPEML